VSCFQSGIVEGSIGWTRPLAMRRFEASPEADTRSYPAFFFMRLYISSELPAYWCWILQPDCFSNGLTHWFSV
jgi:hypothetical protein